MKTVFIILLILIIFYLTTKTEKFTTNDTFEYYEGPTQKDVKDIPSLLSDNTNKIKYGDVSNDIIYKENISNNFSYDVIEPIQKSFINPNNIKIPISVAFEKKKI
jgi:hypothetical protein